MPEILKSIAHDVMKSKSRGGSATRSLLAGQSAKLKKIHLFLNKHALSVDMVDQNSSQHFPRRRSLWVIINIFFSIQKN